MCCIPLNGDVVAPAGSLIDEALVDKIETAGIDRILVRSALTCTSRGGICGKCYGRDLARGTKVNIGEAVGVIAAQSIGEPGTQLTMRTFHIGGAAQRGAEQSAVEAAFDSTLQVKNRNVVMQQRRSAGGHGSEHRTDPGRRSRPRTRPAPCALRRRKLLADDDDTVLARPEAGGMGSVHHSDHHREGRDGELYGPRRRRLDARGDGRNHRHLQGGHRLAPAAAGDRSPAARDLARRCRRGGDVCPTAWKPATSCRWTPSCRSNTGLGSKAGDVLARIPRESSKTRDITGGLPRVAELFEARKPKDYAIISEIDGRVEFGKDYKTKRRIVVVPPEEDRGRSARIPDPQGQAHLGSGRRLRPAR